MARAGKNTPLVLAAKSAMKNLKPFVYVLKIILIFLTVLTTFRVLFFLFYVWGEPTLNTMPILKAFLIGLRFDLAASMLLLTLPLIFIFVPIKNKAYRNILEISLWTLFFIMLTIMTVDLIYYSYSHKRLSFEFLILFHNPIEILGFVLHSFGRFLLIVPVIFYGFIKLFQKSQWLSIFRNEFNSTLNHSLLLICIFIVLSVFAIRGGWQGRPLKPIMAFQNDHLLLGHLGMNGLYNVLTSLYKSESYPIHKNWKKDIGILKDLVGSSYDEFISMDYPFYRKSNFSGKLRPKNVVILIMESWGYDDLSLGGNQRKSTTFFEELSQKGLFFTRNYTPGSRTIQMLPAVVSAIPTLFGNVFTTSSYQSNRQKSLPRLLKKEGYSTLFIYAAKKNSMGFSSYARLAGFEKILSKDDFELSRVEQDGVWGVYDEYVFERLLKEVDHAKKPFLAMIKTIHPHLPHSVPSHRKNEFPPNMDFYDDMRYTDICLKEFFEQVHKKKYFKDTLFIITGDHAYGDKETLSIHHTPLLFYAPKFIQPQRSTLLVSHLDIMPTILEILQLRTAHASMGKSLLSNLKKKQRGKPYQNWSLIDIDHAVGFMNGEYILINSKQKPISMYHFISDPGLNRNLLGRKRLKTVQEAIRTKWNIYASAVGHSIMNDKIVPHPNFLLTH